MSQMSCDGATIYIKIEYKYIYCYNSKSTKHNHDSEKSRIFQTKYTKKIIR